MTTIAVKQEDSRITLAWDSQVTCGSKSKFGAVKVRKVTDQVYLGLCGHLRYLNILHATSIPEINQTLFDSGEVDLYDFLLQEVVPKWQAAVKAEVEGMPGEEKDIPYGSGILVIRDQVFSIGSDFSVHHVTGDYATGSGADFAEAAMHLGATAEEAVRVAADLDIFTGGKISEVVAWGR